MSDHAQHAASAPPQPGDAAATAPAERRPPATITALPQIAKQGDWTDQVSAVAIIQLDPAGRVRSWNPGAERIKGYRAEQIIGQPFERFYRLAERERHLPARLLEKAALQGTAENTGWRVRADGTTFWAHVVITSIRADDGRLTGYVKITRDLTARKAEDERQDARLRGFAHDVLSPVTALRGYVDLLEEAAPEHADLIARISTVSDHLVAMAEELGRQVRGSDGECPQIVDVSHLVYEAAELTLPGESLERLRLRGDDALQVRARPSELRRAVANLIDNAAKYSDGPIEVALAAEDGGMALRVADDGRGIAAEDLPTIFDPYARGRLADPTDGGTGVGLASVRDIVDRLGGQVEIASTLGSGTAITLHLPLG
ncbi:ATP-binding protein [Microbacterium sp. NPDC091313]